MPGCDDRLCEVRLQLRDDAVDVACEAAMYAAENRMIENIGLDVTKPIDFYF